jgi:hypothetical protein
MFTELIERGKTAQWRAEAKAHGWEWIEQVQPTRSLYGHHCGHTQDARMTHMREGSVKCQFCQEEKFKAEAITHGWTRLSKVDGNSGAYQHTCGHTQKVDMSAMRVGYVRCQRCYVEKFKSEASEKGWTWLSQVDGKKSNYQHTCGRTQTVEMGNMRATGAKCTQCQTQKFKSETAQDWTWLAQSGRHRSLYQHVCGYTRSARMEYMRNGWVVCHTCNKTWATKPSELYVLYISLQGEALVKVGISSNLDYRTTRYGLPPEAEVTTLKTVPFATGVEAQAAEQKVLKKFRKHQLKGIGHIMSRSGATECFCPSVLDQILGAVEQLKINQCKIAS